MVVVPRISKNWETREVSVSTREGIEGDRSASRNWGIGKNLKIEHFDHFIWWTKLNQSINHSIKIL